MNNPKSKNNLKLQINQRPFVKQSLRTNIQRLYPCDKNQKQDMQNYKEKLSISENQSIASFKLINQSITSIRSSSQATEAKLGGKKKNWLSPTIPTGIVAG
jgi:hypothetical protein